MAATHLFLLGPGDELLNQLPAGLGRLLAPAGLLGGLPGEWPTSASKVCRGQLGCRWSRETREAQAHPEAGFAAALPVFLQAQS